MRSGRGQTTFSGKTWSVPGFLGRCADLTGAGIFAVLFLALVVQVVRRFVFGAPAAWTEEHAAVDFVMPRFAPSVRRVSYALGLAALGGSFLWALPGIADYLRFMMRERTPVLEWPYGFVYCVFLAAAVMVVLRCLAAIFRPEAPDKA